MKILVVLNSMSKLIEKNSDVLKLLFFLLSYDAVDKVLLHRPHIIRNIEVHLTKGNRYSQSATTSPKTIQTEYSNNHSVLPRRSILKQVQIGIYNVFDFIIQYCILNMF
jgi:hypothetical protein